MIKLYWPLKEGFISQYFGENLNDYSQFGMKGHNGLDMDVDEGTPIYAAHDGKLVYLEDKDTHGNYKGYGKYATITHPEGWRTLYAHQLEFVGTNRNVKQGDLIGRVDSTGFSTGDHLHFGLKPKNPVMTNGYLGSIDPLPYFLMTNTIPVHKAGTQEFGFYVPATNVQAIKDKALNFGVDIFDANGNVDFSKFKDIQGL